MLDDSSKKAILDALKLLCQVAMVAEDEAMQYDFIFDDKGPEDIHMFRITVERLEENPFGFNRKE